MISKNFFRYKILNCYFTTLECKVFKICNYLKWSEITTYSYIDSYSPYTATDEHSVNLAACMLLMIMRSLENTPTHELHFSWL